METFQWIWVRLLVCVFGVCVCVCMCVYVMNHEQILTVLPIHFT